MIKQTNILLFCGILLATGCATPAKLPANAAAELGYSASVHQKYQADTEWWKQYNDVVLNRLVETALANNPDYLKAAVNLNKELYNLNLANLNLLPTLSGDINGSSRRRIDTGDKFADSFSGETGLSYELDLYGKIRNLKTAQEFEYNATIMDKEAAKLTLINSVVDLYFNLAYLKNTIAVTKANIKAYTDIQNITETKYNNGRVDKLEFLEAKQSVISEQNRLLEFETLFSETENSLKNVLNIRQEQPLEIKYADILKQNALGVNLDVPTAVLANRPDLLASQYRLEKAFKTLEAENKNWYPDISLKGLLGSSSDKARTTFDFPYLLGSVAVDLPFLDWNRVRNNIKISEADYQIAAIDFKDMLTRAVNEVAYYDTAYAKAREMYGNTNKNYQNARQITRYYKNRYTSGQSEFKDYLLAQYSENALKNTLIQQKYQLIKYENQLYKAMAGKY